MIPISGQFSDQWYKFLLFSSKKNENKVFKLENIISNFFGFYIQLGFKKVKKWS